MKQIDEIFYDALCADETLMAMIAYTTPQGGRAYAIKSTCFEIPPDEMDNTPVPNIIITDDGFQAEIFTKDDVWDGDIDRVQATVDVAGNSPSEVKVLIHRVRRAINDYICAMYERGEDIPSLQSLNSDGVQWDWVKPCYFQKLFYTCEVAADLGDGDAQDTEEDEHEQSNT